MTTTIGISVREGVGTYHSPAEASTITRLVVAGNVLWILIVNITKASILTQYLRIFCSLRTRALCYTLLACLVPAASYAVFAGIFLCSPTAKLWRPEMQGTCRSAQTYWLSVAGLDIMLDFLVLLLPLPAILVLRLPSRQKIALVLVFTLGFFVCIVSVARLATVYLTAQHGDYVRSGVWAVIWSAVEANVGIICACLLALKPLVAKLCPSLLDEIRLPKHCMQLRAVDTSGARWSQVRFPFYSSSRKGIAVGGGGGGPPATPSSGVSKEGLGIKRWSTARTWVPPEMRKAPEQGLSDLESFGVVERESEMRGMVDRRDDGKMSIWDMLQQPEEVACREGE